MRRLAFALFGSVLVLGCKKPPPSPEVQIAQPPPPEEAHRCSTVGSSFVLVSRGQALDAGPEPDELLPFASEVGEAAAYQGGFAVGAVHVEHGSPSMAVVTLGTEGQTPMVHELGPAHGDIEPPRVAARGGMVLFAVLEPRPSGRAIRIGKLDGADVTWGATLESKGGESQAFDVGAGDKKLVVVWDEETPATARIEASTVDLANVGTATPPRPLTPSDTDADSPRLVARPGGFWLAYIARRGAEYEPDADYVAEDIGYRWIEIVPLDANGSPTGKARAVTPPDGHVMLFDMAEAEGGAALLVYRDDDTPTGGGGGRIMRVLARLSGIEPPGVLVEDDVGAGAPSIVGGWLAITDAAGATLLAPLGGAGDLAGPPAAEPDIGSGEPIAASGRSLLVARSAGRDMHLATVRCVAETLDAGADAPAP